MIHKFDARIDSSTAITLKEDVKQYIKIIRPKWNIQDIQSKVYTAGISNALIGVWLEDKDDQLLFRVYGEKTELFIDREAEKEALMILHHNGHGAELFATFKNGLCYAYVAGMPLSPESVREEKIYRAVAKELATFHKIPCETKESQFFQKIRLFLSLVPSEFEENHKKRLDAAKIDHSFFESEIKEIEEIIKGLKCPVVFSHNDVLLENIIWNEEKNSISFIDFEYAFPNYQGFDIGDHFSEFVGVSPDNMNYDTLYPNEEFQQKWLRVYLACYYDRREEDIEIGVIEKWRRWVNIFALASHLFWGVWTILQAHFSKIDFDFIGYGISRLGEYKKRKEVFLRL